MGEEMVAPVGSRGVEYKKVAGSSEPAAQAVFETLDLSVLHQLLEGGIPRSDSRQVTFDDIESAIAFQREQSLMVDAEASVVALLNQREKGKTEAMTEGREE